MQSTSTRQTGISRTGAGGGGGGGGKKIFPSGGGGAGGGSSNDYTLRGQSVDIFWSNR